MTVIDIPYAPRPQFVPYHKRKQRWAICVAHRRCGKTVATINDIIKRAATHRGEHPRFAYVAPTYGQSKDVAWTYLKKFTATIPGVSYMETELSVTLPNGARIRLYGADNYDRMRGLYFDGVILDEFADMDPRAWSEVVRPALADRQGWATFIGTPKGKNGFWKIWDAAQDDPDWFSMRLKASETGLLPELELDSARKLLSPEAYRREFECDFDAAVEGAYFADCIAEAERDGRIDHVARDGLMTVRAFWDIGGTGAKADATAIWIAQFIGQRINWIDYYEAQGQPLETHVNWLRENNYGKALCVLPHDGAQGDKVFAASYEGALRSAGFDVIVVPNQGKGAAKMRIETARRLFNRMFFDKRKTANGIEVLKAYHEKRDEKRNVGLGPNHDWASHGADAFGLGCVAYDQPNTPSEQKRYQDRSRNRGGSWEAA